MSNKEFLDFDGLSHYDEKIKEYIDMSDEAIFDYFGVDFETGETNLVADSAYVAAIKEAIIDDIQIDGVDSITEDDISNLFSQG